jgi:hypothetical protein
MILSFLGAAIFVFSSCLVLLCALSFLGGFGFESLSRRPLKKDAASPEASGRAMKDIFVFKTYKTFCIFEILTQNPNRNEKNSLCFLYYHTL